MDYIELPKRARITAASTEVLVQCFRSLALGMTVLLQTLAGEKNVRQKCWMVRRITLKNGLLYEPETHPRPLREFQQHSSTTPAGP